MNKVKIADICDLNIQTLKKNDVFENIIYLDTANITENKIDTLQEIKRIDAPSRAQRRVKNNTIIYSTVRPNQKHYGILKNPEINMIVSTGFTTLDIKNPNNVDAQYLYYALTKNDITSYLSTIAENSVSSYPSINPGDLGKLELNLPDFSTQKKIADVLSCIDDKIALNNKTNSELENMVKTVYDYWFTQFDFPDANGNPYKTSGGKMEYNQVLKREIPAGWEVGRLSEIANITMGQSPNGESYNENGEGTIFYQGSTDFGTRSPSIRVYTTAPTRFAKVNDILMSVRAPVGTLNIANTDCCIGRGLAALNSKTKSISFLYCIMRNFQRQFELLDSIGTTFGSITKDDLFGLQVVIPKQEVIDAFDIIGNEIFEKQSKLNEENEELTKLRDYLLPLLMNGQIEVK
ncbi:MAG: restriction endonuclease subunit S [Treponema sp.]|nr:restriction endonuclease subunit S [Treponema sp.]